MLTVRKPWVLLTVRTHFGGLLSACSYHVVDCCGVPFHSTYQNDIYYVRTIRIVEKSSHVSVGRYSLGPTVTPHYFSTVIGWTPGAPN